MRGRSDILPACCTVPGPPIHAAQNAQSFPDRSTRHAPDKLNGMGGKFGFSKGNLSTSLTGGKRRGNAGERVSTFGDVRTVRALAELSYFGPGWIGPFNYRVPTGASRPCPVDGSIIALFPGIVKREFCTKLEGAGLCKMLFPGIDSSPIIRKEKNAGDLQVKSGGPGEDPRGGGMKRKGGGPAEDLRGGDPRGGGMKRKGGEPAAILRRIYGRKPGRGDAGQSSGRGDQSPKVTASRPG